MQAEEEKRIIGARIELLKREKQDLSGSTDAVEKVNLACLSFGLKMGPLHKR